MLLQLSGSPDKTRILPLLNKETQMAALELTIYHFQQKLEFTEIFAGHFSPFGLFWNLKSIFSYIFLLRYENLPWPKEKFKQYLS